MERLDYPTIHFNIYLSIETALLFYSQSRVFNNENNSYPKMWTKQALTFSSVVFITTVDNLYILACLSFWLIYFFYCVITTIPGVLVGSVLLIFFYVVLLCVFPLWVPRCDVFYDFRIKTMSDSSLPPVVCSRVHTLFTLFVLACA